MFLTQGIFYFYTVQKRTKTPPKHCQKDQVKHRQKYVKNMPENVRKKTFFHWNEQKIKAVESIAKGESQQRIAENLGLSERTLRRWSKNPEFKLKVDTIILDMETLCKEERIKIAKAAIRQILEHGMSDNVSSKDLLDWLKYARDECEGTKSRKR